MLKRHQVLLTDWLTDYIRFLSEKYDVSFSEVIRVSLSIFFTEMVSRLYPKYKFPLSKKEMVALFNEVAGKKMSEEEVHRLISKAYFEARKAIEYRISQDKKNKKVESNQQ